MDSDSDWAGAPKHLLDLVFEKIEPLITCLRFTSVCLSWHDIAITNRSKLIKLNHHQVPMLLVPSESERNDAWSIFSIFHNKFLMSNLLLPSYDRPFGGSSQGWLATLDENMAVTLYKSFMEYKESISIHLPPLFPPIDLEEAAKYRKYHVFKFTTFTPDPIANPNDLIIVAIFGEYCELAYIRPAKDTMWTHVPGKSINPFDDVIHYKGQFYALSHAGGQLASFNIIDSFEVNLKLVAGKILKDRRQKYSCYKKYLVESYEGELLQVHRYRERHEDINHVTRKFQVFKLSFDRSQWIEIKDLGEQALFLGDNTSVSVKASIFAGCQNNCIYFTDDKDTAGFGRHGPRDLGMYNLKSGKLRRRFTINAATFAKMRRIPIWVVPTLFNT